MNAYHFSDPGAVGKARTSLAIAAAVGLALVLGAGLMWTHQQQGTVADLQDRIARANALPQSAGQDSGVFLAAEDPNIAQTRMQTQVQELAAQHNMEIEVIRATDVTDEGRVIALGLTVKGVVAEADFAPFLTALSQTEPRILLDEIDLRRARLVSRRDPTRKLAVSLGMSTLMQK